MNAVRRAVLFALAGAALAPRFATGAPRKRLAVMNFEPVSEWRDWTVPFIAALARHGFVDGRNVDVLLEGIVPGQGGGPEPVAARVAKRIPEINPDLIVTEGPITTLVLQLATRKVPIVTRVPDPVGAGYANSLAKPGGNVTGLGDGVEETSVKTMELVKRLLPGATAIAIVSDPRPAATKYAGNFERAAKAAGLEPVTIAAKEHEDQLAGLRALPPRRVGACLWAWADTHPRKIAAEGLAMRLPFFAPDQDWVRFGFLGAFSSYEPDPRGRLAAVAAQVLRGARPGDIPFEFPQQFRLVLNRTTAKALGIEIASDLLLRASEVIG